MQGYEVTMLHHSAPSTLAAKTARSRTESHEGGGPGGLDRIGYHLRLGSRAWGEPRATIPSLLPPPPPDPREKEEDREHQ